MLFPLNTIQAQDTDTIRMLSPQEMKEDVLFFYQKIEETHPNPYCFLDKEQYEVKKQTLLNSLNKPITKIEFWVKIAQLNSIYDAHTNVLFPDSIVAILRKKNCMFFHIGMLEVKNQIPHWGYAEGLPDSLKGRQILSINNISADTIISHIADYVSHEGDISMNNYFRWGFRLMYPLLYDYPKQLFIEYNDNNIRKNIILTEDDFIKWDSISREYRRLKPKPLLFTYYVQEGIAIFELNTFAIDANKDRNLQFETYDKELSKAFDSLIKYDIKHLFVDITRNQGGSSDFIGKLFNYLDVVPQKKIFIGKSDFKVSDASRKSRGLNTRKDYLKIFHSGIARSLLLKRKGKISTYKFHYHKNKSNKRSNIYTNNAYLIQSNLTFSAATLLSSLFKYYKYGYIIGEETGGLTSCYIDATIDTLPNSHIKIICSMQRHTQPGGKEGIGVLPDIEYKINSQNSFTLEQLKEMLQMVEEQKSKSDNNK
jgi:hypothetical protein